MSEQGKQSTDPMAPFKAAAHRGGQAHYVTERSVPDARDVEIARLRALLIHYGDLCGCDEAEMRRVCKL